MKWQTKALAFNVMSNMAGGRKLYELAQRNITKTIPRGIKTYDRYLRQLQYHLDAAATYDVDLEQATYLEFGAGWDLFYPLGMHCAGVGTQYVYDLNPLAKLDLINSVIKNYKYLNPAQFNRIPDEISSMKDLNNLGIHYKAPGDAGNTGLENASVDFISTTSVLEHIPMQENGRILEELKRVSHKDTVISMLIDYEDHYSQRRDGANPYNFLQFEEAEWAKYNPDLHFQNRRRHRDYVQLFADAGLQTLKCETWQPDNWDALLGALNMSSDFEGYAKEELAITWGHFVLKIK